MHLFQLAHSHLGKCGHQVVGDAVGILPIQAALVGTDGVKQRSSATFRLGSALQTSCGITLGKGLGGAVGVGGSAHGEVLGDGHTGGVAVEAVAEELNTKLWQS